MTPEVTVVVATHNRSRRLAALLDSLRAQTLPADRFEVIVVDDASADDTPQLLARQTGLDLQVVRRETSGGPAVARNEGVRRARGAAVAFTDDDCVAHPRWLEAGLAAWDGDGRRFLQGPVGPIADERGDLGAFSYTILIEGPTPVYECANILYPRALLERVGGFDESFGRTGEDADLGWRVREAGGVPGFAEAMRVEHAVVAIGARGYVRRLWAWSEAMKAYARHPELRETLHRRVFWNLSHYLLLRALLGLGLLRRRWAWPLSLWLARWYVAYEVAEARAHAGTALLAPWWVARDVVEVAACVRGSLRYRVLVL